MMLKPFRIRNLYGSSPAVVQISSPQYTATIKSTPDAVLTYLDDDDGEVICVGSAFELEQRLDEPVVSNFRGPQGAQAWEGDADDSLHTFDISHTPASLATWRDHEAYASKMLRKPSSSDSPKASPLSMPSYQPAAPSAPPAPVAVPPPQGEATINLEKAVSGALQGLEAQVGNFAAFLQDTSNALRKAAEQTRGADVSAIGSVLDGFRGIMTEVGKVGKAMIDAFDADVSPASRNLPSQNVVMAPAKATEVEAKPSRSDVPQTKYSNYSKILLKEPAPDSSSGATANVPSQAPKPTGFSAYASLKDPWNLDAMPAACWFCQKKKWRCSGRSLAHPCQNCVCFGQPCTFSLVEPQDCARRDQAPAEVANLGQNSVDTQSSEVPSSTADVPSFVAPLDEKIHRPRETAKTFAQAVKSGSSRSILDLENTDPDFSVRFPPLMSLRKSKTFSSLAGRAKSQSAANINPETAIARYPSLSQLEQRDQAIRRGENLPAVASQAEPQSKPAAPPRPHLKLAPPRLHIPDSTQATVPKLPGAWPEPRFEAEGPTLPTLEESSGAFFNRMTNNRTPHLHRSSSLEMSRPYNHQQATTPAGPGLGRSKTVTASNPAARLTRPFDPLEDLRQAREPNAPPRRAGTERHRRRPYNETFDGTGRTLWESFEASASPPPVEPTRQSQPPPEPTQTASQDTVANGFGIPDTVSQCVKQLREMGYGQRSPHEASRLSVYAAACGGDILDAIEMIEEDRKAGRQHVLAGERMGVRPFKHNARPTFGL